MSDNPLHYLDQHQHSRYEEVKHGLGTAVRQPQDVFESAVHVSRYLQGTPIDINTEFRRLLANQYSGSPALMYHHGWRAAQIRHGSQYLIGFRLEPNLIGGIPPFITANQRWTRTPIHDNGVVLTDARNPNSRYPYHSSAA